MRHAVPASRFPRGTFSCFILALAGHGFSAVYGVSNNNDSGPGSLRQAILDANASPGADSIQLDVLGEIALTSGQLVVNGDVAITGPGADRLALDARGLSRVMNIASGHVLLTGLTVRNARAGVIQYGGGIMVNGDLTLRRCSFENNVVPVNIGFGVDGGAVYVNGGRTLVAEQCLFKNNQVGLGTGGAVRGASSSVLEFRNCTFSGNSATQGGALSAHGNASLDFCTIAENSASHSGGGVWSPLGTVAVSNSIVAANQAPMGPDCYGAFRSSGFNLVTNPANSSGWLATDASADPQLGSLGDHGGETEAYSLLDGSPALNSANPTSFVSEDQRGVVRPQGFGPDRGAFEFELRNAAPLADAGPDQTVECIGALTPAHLDGSSSSDPDGDELIYRWSLSGAVLAEGSRAEVSLPRGEHRIMLTVTDPSGVSASDEVIVRIVDTAGPEISEVSATPGAIWPPNHRMVRVQLAYSVRDSADPNPSRWLTVSSSQADSGLGVDDLPGDIEVLDDRTVMLRAERYGDGRVYTVTIHACDADGNTSSKSIKVCVPKSMGQ